MALFSKKEQPAIKRVKYLGVRTTEQTEILATYNRSLYCFLIEYSDGSRKICEYHNNDKNIGEILSFIEMD